MDLIPSSLTNYTLENYLIRISTKSRIIYLIIIGLVIGGIGVLPFIYVDVSVHAPGLLQSEIEKQKIYAPFHGKVVLTTVKNGKKVEKGDTLIIIDSETTKAQRHAIQKKVTENNSAISDLKKLNLIENPAVRLNFSDFTTDRYFTEYTNMLKSYAIQYQKFQRLKAENERNEILHQQDIIPDADYENSLISYRVEVENLNQIIIYHKTLWQADLMQRKNDAAALQAELERCAEELNNRVVLTPVGGEIIQSSDIQTGTIVGLNQLIAEISPEGELVATCFVNPADIGLINTDQKVRIQVDALNYNEWGLLNAEITEISDDLITEDGSTAYFRIRCKPEKTFLSLKNGVKADLKKGMSLNARIVITRRTLFNLLFDKADKWFNPYLKRKS